MYEYLIPFLAYLFVNPLVSTLFDSYVSYAAGVFVSIPLLGFFWKKYKLKFRFDALAVLVGVVIFVLWVVLENTYTMFYSIGYVPSNGFFLFVKLVGFLLAAPLIEELFTRGFLIRFLVSKEFRKVPIGKYTLGSFIITVLFFGLSHNRWLVGLIAAVLLNLLLYKQKRIESCILAHFTANLLLAGYILFTGSWGFW